MKHRNSLLQLLALVGTSWAQNCGNVTISTAADADAVRKACTTITGDLVLAPNFSESINLDGIETILGDLKHSGCEVGFKACVIPPLFGISSSTLQTINGSLDVWYFPGLEKLLLPKLARVKGGVSLKRAHNLTTLDLTNLQYVQYVVLDLASLKTLQLDGLKGFTGPSNGDIALWNVGQVDNVDGFFKNPLDPILSPTNSQEAGSTIGGYGIPNVRKLTLGWKRFTTLTVSGNDITVTLGGPNTTAMEIDTLKLLSGVVGIQRGEQMNNLTVGKLSVYSNDNITELKANFDRLTSLELLFSSQLKTIILPSAAEQWQNYSLSVSGCSSLNLSSEYTVDGSGQRTKTWYWPKGDIQSVNIDANLSNDFL